MYSVSSANLSQKWETKTENLKFVHPLSYFYSFLSCQHLTWNYKMHTNIIHTKRLLYNRASTFSFLGFCLRIPALPGLLNACVTGCNEFTSSQRCVSSSSPIVFFIYLVLKTNLVQQKTPLTVVHLGTAVPIESRQHFSACPLLMWVAVTSNYLDISFVWMSLVASFPARNTFVYSTEVFVSSPNCVPR